MTGRPSCEARHARLITRHWGPDLAFQIHREAAQFPLALSILLRKTYLLVEIPNQASKLASSCD